MALLREQRLERSVYILLVHTLKHKNHQPKIYSPLFPYRSHMIKEWNTSKTWMLKIRSQDRAMGSPSGLVECLIDYYLEHTLFE